jgi:small conductance mechanosensitive channel
VATRTLVQALLVLAAIGIGWLVLRLAFRRLLHRIERTVDDPSRAARLRTICIVGRDSLLVVLVVGGMLAVLDLLGINTTSFAAVIAALGLALSLGAQSLVKDIIAGVVILVEDQFRLGDVITIQGVTGAVERISLRATHLRAVDGQLHIVPNGDVRLVSNATQEYSRAVVDIPVGFDQDTERVAGVLAQAMHALSADSRLRESLWGPAEVLGWSGATEFGVMMRLTAKVAPGQQWAVAREMRRVGLEALRAAGIPVAMPSAVRGSASAD